MGKAVAWLLKKNKATDIHYVRAEDGGEGLFRVATRLLSEDYSDDVRFAAKNIIEELLDDDVAGEDWTDRIDEYLDGHSRVIYTVQAQAALLCSDNDGYGVEEGLVDSSEFKDGIPWSKLAFWAFREDVRNRLGQLNIGAYDGDNETEDPLEPACEWEETYEDQESDGELEEVLVCKASFTFEDDGGETYVGTGDDREAALLNLRRDYRTRKQAAYEKRRAARDQGQSSSNR